MSQLDDFGKTKKQWLKEWLGIIIVFGALGSMFLYIGISIVIIEMKPEIDVNKFVEYEEGNATGFLGIIKTVEILEEGDDYTKYKIRVPKPTTAMFIFQVETLGSIEVTTNEILLPNDVVKVLRVPMLIDECGYIDAQ
jgi:hypothetical protein